MSVGENIKRKRELANIKQKELAQKIGTTAQNISQYERSIRTPKYQTLMKIAEALDCTVFDLDPSYSAISGGIDYAITKLSPSKDYFDKRLDEILNIENVPTENGEDNTQKLLQAISVLDTLTPSQQERVWQLLTLPPEEQEEALQYLSYAPELRKAVLQLLRASRGDGASD